MTSSLTEFRPPPTLPPIASRHARQRPSTAGYWVAAVVAVLGLTAAFLWGAVGISNTRDRVDGFDRTAVPGQATVSVTDPGTMVVYHESAAEVAGSAEPTANAPVAATRWDPGTRTIVTVASAGDPPTWQQLGLQVTGPGGTAVPVATYRSSARYDLEPGRAGRAVATFPATTPGAYRVSAATATEAGATLAVGKDITRTLVLTRLGAVILGLVTVLVAVPLAVVTYQARSRTLSLSAPFQ
jgi:cytoskeletal protein RodZ